MAIWNILSDREPAEKRWVALAYILQALTVLCLVGSVVLYVSNEGAQSRQREAERVEDQTDARYAACVGFNIEQQGDRSSALNVSLVTFGLTESGDLTPIDREVIVAELDPSIQARYRQVEAQTAVDNPFRDCSPAGITAYYEHPVLDPAPTIPPTTVED